MEKKSRAPLCVLGGNALVPERRKTVRENKSFKPERKSRAGSPIGAQGTKVGDQRGLVRIVPGGNSQQKRRVEVQTHSSLRRPQAEVKKSPRRPRDGREGAIGPVRSEWSPGGGIPEEKWVPIPPVVAAGGHHKTPVRRSGHHSGNTNLSSCGGGFHLRPPGSGP